MYGLIQVGCITEGVLRASRGSFERKICRGGMQSRRPPLRISISTRNIMKIHYWNHILLEKKPYPTVLMKKIAYGALCFAYFQVNYLLVTKCIDLKM